MKKAFSCCLFLFWSLNTFSLTSTDQPNYIISQGVESEDDFVWKSQKPRFGNQVLSYFKAQWLSHISGATYFHRPFDKDYLFNLSDIHPKLNNPEDYEIVAVSSLDLKALDNNSSNVVYIPTMFSRAPGYPNYNIHLWDEMRKDEKFLCKMRYLLSPKSEELKIIYPPAGYKSVAIHVRKGGGYDDPLWSIQYFDEDRLFEESKRNYDYSGLHCHYQDALKPKKSPPEQYYVDQINRIIDLYPNDSIYVHLFTDHPEPSDIVERMKQHLSKPEKVAFGYRTKENFHNKNVIEDFVSMKNFDIFIRTCSSFSVFPHILGKFELVIYPHTYLWVGQCLIYPQVIYERSLDDREIYTNEIYQSFLPSVGQR